MNGRVTKAGFALLAALLLLSAAKPYARAAGASAGPVLYYWASVDNPLPAPTPSRTVTVFGYFVSNNTPVARVRMVTTWTDGHPLGGCSGATDVTGIAQCTLKVPKLRLNSTIAIHVVFTYKGATYTTNTSALPF